MYNVHTVKIALFSVSPRPEEQEAAVSKTHSSNVRLLPRLLQPGRVRGEACHFFAR